MTSLNGQQNAAFGIYLQPGANALNTAEAVEATMKRLEKRFPDGIAYKIPYDTTKFVKVSIEEVIHTFVEALILVMLVVFIFLQNWRATLIPVLAIPVSLIGTFAGMYMLGFSINLLTLFGMVLAIGIVVDDAIVVLENVERVMRTEKLSPRDASIKAMEEVTGPIVAIVLVLCAVFIPVGFLGGLAGQMYKQFAITIAVSVVISGIVALTLSPALCALLLKPTHHEPAAPFRWFNRFFDRATDGYTAGVRFPQAQPHRRAAVRRDDRADGAAVRPGARLAGAGRGPGLRDQRLLPAAGGLLTRTEEVTSAVTEQLMKHPAVQDVVTFAGFDVLTFGTRSNAGVSFVPLKDWKERTTDELDARNLPPAFMAMGAGQKDGVVMTFNPPPITGMSTTGGFEAYIQDRSGGSVAQLEETVTKFIGAISKRPELVGSIPPSTPTCRSTTSTWIAPRRARWGGGERCVHRHAVHLRQLLRQRLHPLRAHLAGEPAGRIRVPSQARGPEPGVRALGLRRPGAAVVPGARAAHPRPDSYARFNVYPAAKILGGPAPGYSSGQALAAMQEVADEVLGEDYSIGWIGSAYQELATQGSGSKAFVFGLILVFLILAAQYERWTLPIAVVTAVPFAVFGAILAVRLRGLSNDVYFQVGLVTLIGLAAKNAILIIEFAVLCREEGMGIFESALEAAAALPAHRHDLAGLHPRCVPLAISSGAGSASRHSIGTGVIGGMLAATLLATFLIPMFYLLVESAADRLGRKKKAPAAE